MEERRVLCIERLNEIAQGENIFSGNEKAYEDYFQKMAGFLLLLDDTRERIARGFSGDKALIDRLYADILPDSYITSYANPDYAKEKLGEGYGQLLSFVYTEIRSIIGCTFEQSTYELVILGELLIQIYTACESKKPSLKEVKDMIYWHMSDYCDVMQEKRIKEMVDYRDCFAVNIIENADLSKSDYLYSFGEYIGEDELGVHRFLNSLSQDEIDRMADTFTEGYRKGFEAANIDLGRKESVNIRYHLGFERVIRKAIDNFQQMGLHSIIYRASSSAFHKKQTLKIGYHGGICNPQFDYDHKEDEALYMDKAYVERKLGALEHAYSRYKDQARVHAGPAVMETYGEIPFVPEDKDSCPRLSVKQQEYAVYYTNMAGQIANRFIPGDERSFTIISFPVPSIGREFENIFRDTVKLNTLDANVYEKIQQNIINVLDKGRYVVVKGRGNNKTHLKIVLHELKNPQKETIFENCVADVNIPVGEVFTSPVLEGTEGCLHVSAVYLNGLRYENLCLEFQNGMITKYSCTNFTDPQAGEKYIRENVLFHHESLPMGEFAIGTNTTAYVMAEKYGIQDKMPILIAEKMGPHFAVGDTCYSYSEENKIYNPDGKEIIAKDNSCSVKRNEDISKAYFNCHTDITIPYDELDSIEVLDKEENHLAVIIKEGRFVLPGCEELNIPLEEENR